MTNNLKPFDLQAALKGEPVILRDGSKAFVRHHETELKVAYDWQLQGIKEDGDLVAWTLDGSISFEMIEYYENEIIGMFQNTRIVNGFEVPAPEKVAPKKLTTCFHANVSHDYFHISYVWKGDRSDLQALKRGLVFLTKEAAITNAKAMLGIDPYEGIKK